MSKDNANFEEKLHRLEQIVRTMEKGEVPLDEALKLFQEGTGLIRSCEQLLDDAELQVNEILAGADGVPVEEVFADGESL